MRHKYFSLLISIGFIALPLSGAVSDEVPPLVANKIASETRDLRDALMAQPDTAIPIVETLGRKLKDLIGKIPQDKLVGLTPESAIAIDQQLSHAGVAKAPHKELKFFDLSGVPTTKREHSSPVLRVDFDPAYQDYIRQASAGKLTFYDPLVDKYKLGMASVGGNNIDENDNETLSFIMGFPRPNGCSGIRVGSDVLLTAGHCVCNAPTELRMGATINIFSPGRSFAVLKTWTPNGTQCANLSSFIGQDIGLVQFAENKALLAKIPILRVATPGVLEKLRSDRHTIIVAGYGWTSQALQDFGHKNFIRSPILSLDCDPDQAVTYGCIAGKELLALDHRLIDGKYYGAGPCFGDSGGAGMVYLDDPDTPLADPQFFLVAVISRPIINASKCGDGAIFTLLNNDRLAELQTAATQLIGRDFTFAENEAALQTAQR